MKSYFVSFCILASLTLGTTMRPALAHPPYEPNPLCTCNCFCLTYPDHGAPYRTLTYPQIFLCTLDCHALPFLAELDDMVLNAAWAGLIGTQAPSLAAKSIKADTNKAVGKTIQRGDATTVASDSPMFGEKKEKWAQEHYSAETKQTLDQWRKELSSQDAAVQQQNAQKGSTLDDWEYQQRTQQGSQQQGQTAAGGSAATGSSVGGGRLDYTLMDKSQSLVSALSTPFGEGVNEEAAFGFLNDIDLNNPQNAALFFIRELMMEPKEQNEHGRAQFRQKRAKAYIDGVLFSLATANYAFGQAEKLYPQALSKVDADIQGLSVDSDLNETLRVRIKAQEFQNQLLATINEIAAADVILLALENMDTTNTALPYWLVDPNAKPPEEMNETVGKE